MLEHLYNPYSRDYLRNAIYKTPGLEPLTCDVQTIEQIYLNYVQESDNISRHYEVENLMGTHLDGIYGVYIPVLWCLDKITREQSSNGIVVLPELY